MESLLNRYARLLVDYCLEIEPRQKLFIKSTTLAEPLVREVYRVATQRGALVQHELSVREQGRLLMKHGTPDQLGFISPLYKEALETYDAFLSIMAPFNLRENQQVDPDQKKIRQQALRGLLKTYSERTATRDLKRSLCVFPTQAFAQNAGMSLEEYEDFVFGACRLYDQDPPASWLQVRADQQHLVDHLNACQEVSYHGEHIDIRFSTKGRTWINSDGRTNMPSGEVYTSPVENSVNGHIHFSFPGLYMGHEVENVTLWVKDGYIERWEASRGKDFLDQIFSMEGARRFGEAAIGTNYKIDRLSRNILFDEKIGGTVHMAIGQSYLQAGGKNQSSVHWDMITDMRNGGYILADGDRIYEDGSFLI